MNKKTFVEFLDWIVSTRQNLVKAILALVMITATGAYLMMVPWRIRERSISKLSDEITSTNERIHDVSHEWEKVDQWYDPSYDDQFNSQLNLALEKINSAEQYRDSAKEIDSPDSSIATAQIGMTAVELADTYVESADLYIDNANQSRETAVNGFDVANKRLSELNKNADAILRGFNKEAQYYPQKRIAEYRMDIDSSHSELNEVKGLLLNAQQVLPADSDETNKGNPNRANGLLTRAGQELDTYQKLLGQVSEWSATLKEARLNAEPVLNAARDKIATSEATIENVSRTRGYRLDGALNGAVSLLQQAKAQIDFGQNELSQKPTDYITALAAAQAAQLYAETSENEVKVQIELDNESMRLISELRDNIKETTQLTSRSAASLQVLASYHDQAAWSHVANNVTDSKNALVQAQKDLVDLEAARANQQFKLAVGEGLAGLDMLKQARMFVTNVDTAANKLESARSSWAVVEADAHAAIVDSRVQVNQYAGYSSRAVTQLAHAESLLNEAQNLVAGRYYYPAVEKAQAAATEAREAKRLAYADYQDEQRREARRQAAEAAAAAAAEAARQQQLQDLMDDSNDDYDYGGSNFGGSNNNNYDYGGGIDLGGGSDNGGFDYGGGNDYGGFGDGGGSDYDSFPY